MSAQNDVPLSSRGEPKGPPQACLFVASLALEVTEDGVKKHFSQFGEVLKVKLLKDRSSRPYAFVQFANVKDADDAIDQMKGKALLNSGLGRRVRVERANVNRTLFIAKFPTNMSSPQLREVVETYGQVESVTIIKNHKTGTSKGCGFVKFIYREDAMDALAALKNEHRKWVVEWATSEGVAGPDKNTVFVGGLNSAEVTKELLQERFGQYGEIESVNLVNKEEDGKAADSGEGNPKSAYAFIRYSDPAAAAAAVEHENGEEWLERRLRVQYGESQETKNKRKAKQLAGANTTANPANYYKGAPLPLQAPFLVPNIPLYNLSPTANAPASKTNQFARKDAASAYPASPFNYGMLYPWLYSSGLAQPQQLTPQQLQQLQQMQLTQQLQLQQQLHQLHQFSLLQAQHQPGADGSNAAGLSESLAAMSLNQPQQQPSSSSQQPRNAAGWQHL